MISRHYETMKIALKRFNRWNYKQIRQIVEVFGSSRVDKPGHYKKHNGSCSHAGCKSPKYKRAKEKREMEQE